VKIKDYKESDIRKTILTKAKPVRINKGGKHWKGYIVIGDTTVAKVKIPNDHPRIMHQDKSKYIARDLKLSYKDFNLLNDCPMTRTKYYKKLAKYS